MACEVCLKAEDIQKILIEYTQLKEEIKALKENQKTYEVKTDSKVETINKELGAINKEINNQITTQALMSQQLSNIDKTLNKFIDGEFKEFVKEFKELSDKPKKRWDLVVTGIISTVIAILAKTGIDKLLK